MAKVGTLLLALVVAVAGQITSNYSGIENMRGLFSRQQSTSPSLLSTAVVSSLTGSIAWTGSAAYGNQRVTPSVAMSLDTPVRIGSTSELLVVAAALLMTNIAQKLDEGIPNQYVPNGLSLVNPSHPTRPITFRMLMQHTSSLVDSGYHQYIATPTCSGNTCAGAAAEEFRTFMDTIFFRSSNNQVNPALFSTGQPGMESTYNFSHINTALLAYVMDKMIQNGLEQVVSTTSPGVGTFIQERIIYPLGMGTTFYLDRTGTVPKTGTVDLPALVNMMVYEYASDGVSSARFVHPNYAADIMQFSSALDLTRLANVLLAQTSNCVGTDSLCAVGAKMREMTTGSTVGLGNPKYQFHKHQGLGVQFFDGSLICAKATQAGFKCPLQSDHRVWGYVAAGTPSDRTATTGIYCTNAVSSSTQPASCVVVVQAFRQSASQSPDSNVAFAGAAFQELFGENQEVATTGDADDDLYGVWVTLGVLGTIGFVALAAYFTEYLIQPPPPIGPGPFRPPQGPDLSTAHTGPYPGGA